MAYYFCALILNAMRGLIVFFVLTFAVFQLVAQKREPKPDEKIIVNKKFDDQGNLLRFDSTYIHQWSSDSTLKFDDRINGFELFNGNDWPDMDQFLEKFFGDTVFNQFRGKEHFFGKSPFGSHFFGKDLKYFFGDSLDFDFNPLVTDSVEVDNLLPRSDNPGFFNKRRDFNRGLQPEFQEFENPEQQKEWDQLMLKQHKERMEFQKRWNRKNKTE